MRLLRYCLHAQSILGPISKNEVHAWLTMTSSKENALQLLGASIEEHVVCASEWIAEPSDFIDQELCARARNANDLLSLR